MVCASLTEFEFGVERIFIFLLGDHLEFEHLAEDGPHSSLCISLAGFPQGIVVRRALWQSCDQCAFRKSEF